MSAPAQLCLRMVSLTIVRISIGKGLAAHLEVPLPYLLYRVNARFQEEIRGLKDIQDTLSPTGAQPTFPSPLYAAEATPAPPMSPRSTEKPGQSAIQRIQTKLSGSSRLSASSRMNTPLGVRARLNSLTNNVQASSPRRASASDNATLNVNSNSATSKKGVSSSTLTLQADSKRHHPPIRNADPFSESSDEDSDDEELRKEEEADRAAEEQETLARRLEELQRMMTNEAIGLVSSARPRRRSLTERGRLGALSPRSVGSSYRGNGHDTLSSSGANSASRSAGRGSESHSQSLSEVGSPQGSIPDIPSPQGSQPHSPRGHRFYNDGRMAGSPNGGLGSRFGPLQNGNGQRYHAPSDDYGSSHGSETSSFTDLSGESHPSCPHFTS